MSYVACLLACLFCGELVCVVLFGLFCVGCVVACLFDCWCVCLFACVRGIRGVFVCFVIPVFLNLFVCVLVWCDCAAFVMCCCFFVYVFVCLCF